MLSQARNFFSGPSGVSLAGTPSQRTGQVGTFRRLASAAKNFKRSPACPRHNPSGKWRQVALNICCVGTPVYDAFHPPRHVDPEVLPPCTCGRSEVNPPEVILTSPTDTLRAPPSAEKSASTDTLFPPQDQKSANSPALPSSLAEFDSGLGFDSSAFEIASSVDVVTPLPSPASVSTEVIHIVYSLELMASATGAGEVTNLSTVEPAGSGETINPSVVEPAGSDEVAPSTVEPAGSGEGLTSASSVEPAGSGETINPSVVEPAGSDEVTSSTVEPAGSGKVSIVSSTAELVSGEDDTPASSDPIILTDNGKPGDEVTLGDDLTQEVPNEKDSSCAGPTIPECFHIPDLLAHPMPLAPAPTPLPMPTANAPPPPSPTAITTAATPEAGIPEELQESKTAQGISGPRNPPKITPAASVTIPCSPPASTTKDGDSHKYATQFNILPQTENNKGASELQTALATMKAKRLARLTATAKSAQARQAEELAKYTAETQALKTQTQESRTTKVLAMQAALSKAQVKDFRSLNTEVHLAQIHRPAAPTSGTRNISGAQSLPGSTLGIARTKHPTTAYQAEEAAMLGPAKSRAARLAMAKGLIPK